MCARIALGWDVRRLSSEVRCAGSGTAYFKMFGIGLNIEILKAFPSLMNEKLVKSLIHIEKLKTIFPASAGWGFAK